MSFGRAAPRIFPATVLGLTLVSCSGSPSGSTVLTTDMPLHLEDHIDDAIVVGSEVPSDLLASVEWHFDEPQPDWQAPAHRNPYIPPLQMTQTEDALRITLNEAHRDPRNGDRLHGEFYVPVPDLKLAEWGHVLVRARSANDIRNLSVLFNLSDLMGGDADQQTEGMFQFGGGGTPVINDGSVHSYLLSADWSPSAFVGREDPWQELGFAINAGEPSSFEILSISILPKATLYADAPAGLRSEDHDIDRWHSRRALYTHVPGRVEYCVRVPEAGRLDVGLGVIRDDVPMDFRITVTPSGGQADTLLAETYADMRWAQRSMDLSSWAGQTVTLALDADAEPAGAVALWAAPTLSGARIKGCVKREATYLCAEI